MQIFTGIDLVEIARVEQSVEKFGDRFLERLFTPEEVAYCHAKHRSAQHLAARFAVKEAVVKATSRIERLEYKQIEVVNDVSGCPSVKIHGSETITGDMLSISITHAGDYAAATAVLLIRL